MDVRPATDFDFLQQLLAQQGEALQRAKARKGQRPRDRKSREDAYSKFMMIMAQQEMRGRFRSSNQIRTSIVATPYLPSVASIPELKAIAIKDLQLELHHRGTYLLLRSLTPPDRMTAIMALMEDEHGDAVLVQLYQQKDEGSKPAINVVNIGTILLIKEPYFKVMADGEYGVRVDHVSDVVHLENDNIMIPKKWQPRLVEEGVTAESFKLEGNRAMKNGRYWDAILQYSQALRQSVTEDEFEVIKRNRALAYLKTEQYDAALADTQFQLSKQDASEKAMFRAAEAFYNLGRFASCSETLDLLLTNFPGNVQAEKILERAQSRQNEQQSGSYNFKQLQIQAESMQPPHLEAATFIGPVEVKQTKSKGRGLFLTKNVKAGDLLLCEKAYSHAFVADSSSTKTKGTSTTTVLFNFETKSGFVGGQADLITIIVQKMLHNPSLAVEFTKLCRGSYEGLTTSIVDDKQVIDTFLIERIMSLNVFGCPVSSKTTHEKERRNEDEKEKKHSSCGIWTKASYINHSCTSNARRAFIGDLMIVRATRDLDAGTEITFWYQHPFSPDVKIPDERFKNWGFACDCAICVELKSRTAKTTAEVKKIQADMKRAYFGSRGVQVDRFEACLAALDRTYTRPAQEVPRLLLYDPQLALIKIYAALNDTFKCLEGARKLLVYLGFVVTGLDLTKEKLVIVQWGLMADGLIEMFVHCKTAFAMSGAQSKASEADSYAKLAYKIVVGEDATYSTVYS